MEITTPVLDCDTDSYEDTMALQLELFDGVIPTTIHLADEDIVSMVIPPETYISFPRLGYLGSGLNEVIEHFKPFVLSREYSANEVWFDYDGEPLNW